MHRRPRYTGGLDERIDHTGFGRYAETADQVGSRARAVASRVIRGGGDG